MLEGVGVNPTTNKIYVPNYDNDIVSVIDGNPDSVIPANPIPIPISILSRP